MALSGGKVFALRGVAVGVDWIGGMVGGGVLRAGFAKRRGWEEVSWQWWANGEVSEIGKQSAMVDM